MTSLGSRPPSVMTQVTLAASGDPQWEALLVKSEEILQQQADDARLKCLPYEETPFVGFSKVMTDTEHELRAQVQQLQDDLDQARATNLRQGTELENATRHVAMLEKALSPMTNSDVDWRVIMLEDELKHSRNTTFALMQEREALMSNEENLIQRLDDMVRKEHQNSSQMRTADGIDDAEIRLMFLDINMALEAIARKAATNAESSSVQILARPVDISALVQVEQTCGRALFSALRGGQSDHSSDTVTTIARCAIQSGLAKMVADYLDAWPFPPGTDTSKQMRSVFRGIQRDESRSEAARWRSLLAKHILTDLQPDYESSQKRILENSIQFIRNVFLCARLTPDAGALPHRIFTTLQRPINPLADFGAIKDELCTLWQGVQRLAEGFTMRGGEVEYGVLYVPSGSVYHGYSMEMASVDLGSSVVNLTPSLKSTCATGDDCAVLYTLGLGLFKEMELGTGLEESVGRVGLRGQRSDTRVSLVKASVVVNNK